MRASAMFAPVLAIRSIAGACAIVACAGGLASCGSFGAAETNVDGGVPDAGGSTDAGGASDSSGSARFCSSPSGPTRFCEDFDDATDLAPPFDFDTPNVVSPGQLSIDKDLVRSAPRSLVASLSGGGLAWIEKNVSGPLPTHLSITFELRVIDYVASSTPTGHFVEVRCASTDNQHIYLKIDDGSLSLGVKQDPGPLKGSYPSVFVRNTWAKVGLVLDKPPAGGYQVTVFVNDAQVANAQNSDALSSCLAGNLKVGLGTRSSDPSSTTAHFSYGFDNVLIEWN